MAQRASPPPFLTVDEYLELEEGSSIKHEYVEGALYTLAGISFRHNRISLRIASLLRNTAEGTSCQVYMVDVKCQVGNVFYYPDVMVACEPTETDTVTYRRDPCLLVEVISPSTASTDRREKLLIYRQIPTLRAYLIVDQDTRRVERHYRDPQRGVATRRPPERRRDSRALPRHRVDAGRHLPGHHLTGRDATV